MCFINAFIVDNRMVLRIIEHLRHNSFILISNIFCLGIPVRTDGRASVCMFITDARRAFLLVKSVYYFRIASRAIHDFFICIIIGRSRQSVSVIIVDTDSIAQGRMNHPFSVKAKIILLRYFSVSAAIGCPLHMESILAETWLSFRVKIRLF